MNIGGQSLKFEDGQWITGSKSVLLINKQKKKKLVLFKILL